MRIARQRTSNGYVLNLVCERCEQAIRRVDAQQPLWSCVVAMDDHNAREHRPERWDEAVGRAAYKHPGRDVQTVHLPELPVCPCDDGDGCCGHCADDGRCRGCGEPSDKGAHGPDACV